MNCTAVLVDDSPFMVDMLSAFFTDTLGFKVLATGNNGMQAVSLYKQHRPDLIALDLTMPVKDGQTALKEILQEFPDAKILMITSQLGPTVVACLQAGAAGYIEKPLQFGNEEFVRDFTKAVSDITSGK